jgi:hypothetical protein
MVPGDDTNQLQARAVQPAEQLHEDGHAPAVFEQVPRND